MSFRLEYSRKEFIFAANILIVNIVYPLTPLQ